MEQQTVDEGLDLQSLNKKECKEPTFELYKAFEYASELGFGLKYPI